MKTVLLIATAVALVPAVAIAASMPAKTYVMKAGASDLFEIESSKLVQNSSNPKVAEFATMMVTDHTKSTDDVKAAATADGITPSAPMLTAKQKVMLDKLNQASGTARDAVYEKEQLAAHTATLALQKDYATSGDKPHLKSVAATIVPVVEHHIAAMKSITAGTKS